MSFISKFVYIYIHVIQYLYDSVAYNHYDIMSTTAVKVSFKHKATDLKLDILISSTDLSTLYRKISSSQFIKK